MLLFTVDEIVEAVGGKLLDSTPALMDKKITGVSTDTRNIKQGDLFIPLAGERFDGHFFLDEAIEKGAAAVLLHREDAGFLPGLFPHVAVIKVDDTLKGLQDLAHYHRKRFDIPVVAVTGSNGKTTTKDLIGLVLSQKYNVLKTEGNLNNEIGLPHTLLGLESRHEIVVVEMGMSALGEIHRLAEIARPTMAVITNIGVSHLENLGSRENILKAKMEVLDFLSPGNKAVLNGDDEYLGSIKRDFAFDIIYYGMGGKASLKAIDIRPLGERGIAYDLTMKGETFTVELCIPGRHNVYNSLAAVAIGDLFGIGSKAIRKGLKTFHPGDMRLNIFTTPGGIRVIDDVYNASPDSMNAAVEILGDFSGRRRIAVLGDMLELGDYSRKGHMEVGRAVVQNSIDILVTMGEQSQFIRQGALDMGMDQSKTEHFNCNKDVTKYLASILEPGDTILVKGSRGMKMEEVVEQIQKMRT